MKKDKLETMVSRSQLEILTGIDFDIRSILKQTDERNKIKNLRLSLKEISDSSKLPKTKSHDERFDGKCAIRMMVESLEKNGLPNRLVDEVCSQKSNCVRKDGLVGFYGRYGFLTHLINQQQYEKVVARMENVKIYFNVHGKMP